MSETEANSQNQKTKENRFFIASVVSVVIATISVGSYFLLSLLGTHYDLSIYVCIWLFTVLGGLVIIAPKAHLFHHRILKICCYVAGACMLFSACFLFVTQSDVGRDFTYRRICGKHLNILHTAMIKYSKANNGKLPIADKWCDLLMKYDETLAKNTFKCPAAKNGICNYAFNKNLGEMFIDDVADDVVLIYEAEGGSFWNMNGGAGLLATRHGDKYLCLVLFANGKVLIHSQKHLEQLKWEDEQKQ